MLLSEILNSASSVLSAPSNRHPMDATGTHVDAFGPEGLGQMLGNGKAEDIRKRPVIILK